MRHDLLHKAQGFGVGRFGIDQYFTNILAQVVTNRTDDDVAFLHQQGRCGHFTEGALNGFPQFDQIVEIPLQFFRTAANTGCADDHAHFVGNVDAFHGFAQFGALIAFNATGNTTGTRVVGHQYHVTASEADLSGQGCALVAALFLVDLNNDFLTFFQHITDVDATWPWVLDEVLAGNFFQRQKTVAFSAKVDESRFQRRLDTSDLAFVDVGFFLFAGAGFNVQIV